MTSYETVAEFATERAAHIKMADRIFMTGHMLVKETFADTLVAETFEAAEITQYTAPELRLIGRAAFKLAANVLGVTKRRDDNFANRVLSINKAAIDQSIRISHYDKNGLVAQ